MEDHLQRFQNSAKLMGLEIPFSKAKLKRQVLDLAKANKVIDAGIHMILTGGYSVDAFTPSNPNLILLARFFVPPPESNYKNGIKLLFWEHKREIPEIKTINYIVPIISLKKRAETGVLDILYHDGKYISECSRSNLFIVSKEDKLITPENGILKGITRKHLLEVAKDICNIEIRNIKIDEIKSAKEVFTTSTTKRVMPVVQIDDYIIGNGKPGAVSLDLSKRLQTYIENEFFILES